MRWILFFIGVCLVLPASVWGWSGSPQRIAEVTTTPVLVAAAHDGAYGAIVAWRPSGPTGPVRTLHLLADGTVDASWPIAGLALSTGTAACTGLEAIEDLHGGAYIHWQEGQQLYLTRVLSSGVVATGWTARGRMMGKLTSDRHRPWTELDADGGLYLGLFQGAWGGVQSPSIRTYHLRLDGTGAGGWAYVGRGIPLDPEATEWVPSASFAVASDGGMWVLVATGRIDEAGESPGEWRLARIMPHGTLDPDRPPQGTVLEPFDATPLAFEVPLLCIGAVVEQGVAGLITARGIVTPSGSGSPAWNAVGRVERRLTDGTPVAGQGLPVEVGWWWRGLGPFCGSPSVGACESAPYSLQLVRDGDDGAVVVFPEYYVDGELLFRACRIAATGLSQSVGGGSGPAPRLQRTRTDSFLITRFHVTGPNYFIGPPELVVYWSDGRGVRLEEDFSPYQPVYSDLAAAPLPDGGAIAVWGRLFAAQSGLSPGLYAQRIGANGTVLEASHSPRMSDGLSLSRTGSGVLATWPSGAPGTLRMHDVLGREVARHDIGSEAGTVHLTLEGASPTGIYFGRITRRDGSNATARVFMLR